MRITTQRTMIAPFSLELIEAARAGLPLAIDGLSLHTAEEWPEPDLREALPVFRELLLKNGRDGFNSWIIVENGTNEIVGSLGFLGEPDAAGRVELGFGILPGKRRRGYCLESVGALLDWARGRERVKRIVAQCEPENFASRAVLSRAGFTETSSGGPLMEWELDVA